ncbi:hypothetical protein DFH08DRAFT_1083922 [Mycena albidolilacea]|uniref:Glycosyl transferase CAP10 domain-containing protein n=1 Tax=Mycena albidolilacea TaxID=1033008 RepID=A0AAD7EKC0_9AGAR|nr:hypothetical protein DFH08DRAFT_1083922 [Mycena albidolilacea]
MPSFLLPLYSPRSLMDWASSCRSRRPRYCLALLGGVCALIFLATISNTTFPSPAKKQINAIIASQSKNLKQARARYILKNNRPPPPNFDKWFTFARENKCLIDDYDQIHQDFEPFYRIWEKNSTHFQNMIRMGLDMVIPDSRPDGLTNIAITDGKVSAPNDRTYFDNEWRDRIAKFAHILPDMDVLVNGHDEPRVMFNTQDSDARLAATELRDNKPFRISPINTSEFFTHHSGCSYVNDNRGFGASSLQDVGFIHSSSSSGFTTDLWPMLSFTKIPLCFSDILFPSQIGAAIAHAHPDLVDAQMTDFWGSYCTFDCNSEPIIEEYDIGNHHSLPRETVHKFKYVLDIDGNTFSGRYIGLLKSGSLVFKSTGFQEYFTDWLRPYEHYIPVKLDLSDLADRVKWAIENEDEARLNNCYFAAVLLEWARLQNAAAGWAL